MCFQMSNPVPYRAQLGNLRVFQPGADDKLATIMAVRAAFGMLGDVELDREHLRPDERRLSVADGDTIIGGCFAYAYRMSLPGGADVPVAGLAGVGVSPDAQGRGAFRPLLEGHIKQSAALGDAASILMASESGLYGRFGYGQATDMAVWQLDVRDFALQSGFETAAGRMLLLDNAEDTIARVAPVHEAACRRRGGDVLRDAEWWPLVLGAAKRSWFGGGPQFVAAWENPAGELDAYALYVLEDVADDAGQPGTPANRLTIRELVARSVDAETALFAALCRVSWVREVVWELAPVDPPVKHRMTDPRQLRQHRRLDMSWLRPLDPAALLTGRHYLSDGQVVIDYSDPVLPSRSGVMELTVKDGVPSVSPADPTPEAVSLRPDTLGQLVLGGTRVLELVESGHVTGSVAALRALDRLLLTERAPFNLTKF